MGVWVCDEKQIPPAPLQKGGEKKTPDFLTVNDDTRPLEIPPTPIFEGGLGGICFHAESQVGWAMLFCRPSCLNKNRPCGNAGAVFFVVRFGQGFTNWRITNDR